MSKLRNSFQKNSKGDVVITLLPGWLELDDENNPVGESNAVVSSTPVYFYGWNIEPKRITATHSVIDIAPTICEILRLPYPNAATGKPIEEIINK
jgi:bisphosphoglycerate-independent phosphoglycerate mutase (AlkP superfamily)